MRRRFLVVQSITILFLFPQTNRGSATNSSCIFICSFSRFPKTLLLLMMMMLMMVVVVFPVTVLLATFSSLFTLFCAQEHAISLVKSTTHFCRCSTITTNTTSIYYRNHCCSFFPCDDMFGTRFFPSFLFSPLVLLLLFFFSLFLSVFLFFSNTHLLDVVRNISSSFVSSITYNTHQHKMKIAYRIIVILILEK